MTGSRETGKAESKPDSQNTSGFVATESELIILVKEWTKRVIRDQYWWFIAAFNGLREVYAAIEKWQRVHEIGRTLGDELTRQAVDEAIAEEAQNFDRNAWIVFHYGNEDEHLQFNATRIGEVEFDPVPAAAVAAKVVERVFRDSSPEDQEALLKEELRRYATKLERFIAARSSGGDYERYLTVELFGINFPAALKMLVSSTGAGDPDPNPENEMIFNAHFRYTSLSLDQGKKILRALDAQGEDWLRALIGQQGGNA